MFSTDKKSLLCIRCFRDMQGWVVEGARGEGAEEEWSQAHPWAPCRESRAHCVDLESAYVQGCERLEQAVLVSEGGPASAGVGAGAGLGMRARQAEAAFSPGREGPADGHTGGYRAAAGHGGGGATQRGGGGGRHPRAVQQHAGEG